GRYIIVYREGQGPAAVQQLMSDQLGLETISTSDFASGVVPPSEADDKHVYLEKLGVGISNAEPDELQTMALSSMSSGDSAIELIVPERVIVLGAIGGSNPSPIPFPIGAPPMGFPFPF